VAIKATLFNLNNLNIYIASVGSPK